MNLQYLLQLKLQSMTLLVKIVPYVFCHNQFGDLSRI